MFDDFLDVLEADEFEERPVDIVTFVEGREYLGLPPLSEEQYKLVRASTQVYLEPTLISLHGEEEGRKRWKGTINFVVAQLGKGSGKDYCSTISIAYIVYQLLCLRDPARYYGKSTGDAIDIINVAINSDQAKNVFFAGFKRRIDNSPWFAGKYHPTALNIEFDKAITCYSGHSERESFEGYNTFAVVLDEISGFAMDSTTGNENAKTAESIYKMYRGSVMSRFPAVGKVIELSFPRYKGDFIQTHYNQVVRHAETEIKTVRLKIMDDLPDGIAENEMVVEYEHDNIVEYSQPKTFALRRATWEVNPTWSLEAAKSEFFADPIDALSRFACMPPEAIDAFFKSREKIELAFSQHNPFTSDWRFYPSFVPKEDVQYYVHIDLGKKHDRAVVAMAHVNKWVDFKIGQYNEPQPVVKVDCVRYWTPRTDQEIDFTDIRNFVIELKRRGFDLKLVTLDNWQSMDTIKFFLDNGLESDRLSVAKQHYSDLQLLVQEERIKGPNIDLLINELLKLRIMRNDKIDHPRSGSKDLADAVCGAAYNAVAHTDRPKGSRVVEVHNLESMRPKQTNIIQQGPIRAPKTEKMPSDLSAFIDRMRTI